MSEKRIYIEGGGGSKELHARCREGFRKLLERSGLQGRVPRLVACGSRNDAYDDFQTACQSGHFEYVALIVDSEAPVKDIEKVWEHLSQQDRWNCPAGATDDQVFLMTTCMETWIVADRTALSAHYGRCLQTSALPALTNLESRDPHTVQDALVRATKGCANAYAKTKRSFEILGKLDPDKLQNHLPSFARLRRLLEVNL